MRLYIRLYTLKCVRLYDGRKTTAAVYGGKFHLLEINLKDNKRSKY